MMLTFDCPNCQQPQTAPPDPLGRFPCTACGAMVHLFPTGEAKLLYVPPDPPAGA